MDKQLRIAVHKLKITSMLLGCLLFVTTVSSLRGQQILPGVLNPISVSSSATTQLMLSGTYALPGATTAYCPLNGPPSSNGFQQCNTGSPAAVYGAWPDTGAYAGIRATLGTAPGTGNSVTVCIYRNGACLSDSTLTISNSSTDSGQIAITDSTAPITTSNGMLDCLEIVSSGSAATTNVYVTLEYQSSTPGRTVMMGNGSTSNSNGYYSLTGTGVANGTTEANVAIPMPVSGTLSKFYVYRDTSPNGGGSLTISGRANFAAGTTPPSVTITTSNCLTGPCVVSDTTDVMPVSANDIDDLAITESGPPTSAGNTAWGLVFTPTVSGQFILASSRSITSLATGTLYESPIGRGPGVTEAIASQAAGYAFTVVAISGFTTAAQSSGVGFTFQLRGGCTAPGTGCSNLSGATFNIEGAGTNTTGSATGLSNTVSAGTWFDWSSAPVGSPSSQVGSGLAIAAHI